MISFSKIFPWLSIRSKLIIAFAGLSVIPVALMGIHSIYSNKKMMEKIALENLNHDVLTIREKTENFLSNNKNDLRVLRNLSLFERFVEVSENDSHTKAENLNQQISTELLAFTRTKNIYYEIRIIGENGDEVLRVEALNNTDSSNVMRIVPHNELRHTRETFYFLLMKNLSEEQITFVPAELEDQNSTRVPVISFAMPLIGKKKRVGLLIANVFAKDLFHVIESKRHQEVTGKIALVNSEGHYLYHSEKKKDWNKLLASFEKDNLQHDYSAEINTSILSGKEGTITDNTNEIISYAPLLFVPNDGNGQSSSTGFAGSYFIFESISKDIIMQPVRSFTWTFSGFLLIFLAGAIGLGLLATQQFTKPIAELQRGAEIISKGNYGHRLSVETHDEIEKLAEQFNAMAISLEAHEHEIEQHHSKLEEMVKHRTRELAEEKAKLQAILDHVPIAFVLVDRQFHIQTASMAFGNITGFRFEDVKGQDSRTLFCKNNFSKEVVRDDAISSKIVSHIDSTIDNFGAEKFIEHIIIPIVENGEISSIVEILTDITHRKRFEQQLIHSEKLMALGEMSAIIAHEFRNALTSIKMILQLQHESDQLDDVHKKSLRVALDSIYHMESIVQELLNFARPTPMKFQYQSVNNIIDECLTLVKLRMNKLDIALQKTLDPHLPNISMDGSHFKEAIVNLLINAIQAIENKVEKNMKENISISSTRMTLSKTLHDLNLQGIERSSSTMFHQNAQEIILRKGLECILISISDSGPGIEKQILSRIFDPFFTTKTNGTGLGLPMVKRTIDAHGGIVIVKSRKDHGTTFCIYLPLLNGDEA